MRGRRRARTRTARAKKPPQVAPAPLEIDQAEMAGVVSNPLSLLAEARILPKFEAGDMVGLQVNEVASGSQLEEAGMRSGDVITMLNGNPINGAEESARAMAEIAGGQQVIVEVSREDGSTETLTIDVN